MRLRNAHLKSESGQALVETAVVLPVLLILTFNAINFGYFFIVAVNLAVAPRSGVEYSILGSSTPAGNITGLPDATPATATSPTVAAAAYEDLHGALSTYANASVQVCSRKVLVGASGVNGTGATLRANCVTCTSQSSCGSGAPVTSGGLAPAPDPEAPSFVLHRVDVTFTFSTLIPGAPFNLALLPTSLCNSSGTCSFHRQVSMRAMD
jgi:Flp pilus assembly protein TadG